MRIGYNGEACQTAYFPGKHFGMGAGMKCPGQIQKAVKKRPCVDGERRDLEWPLASGILEKSEDVSSVPARPVWPWG